MSAWSMRQCVINFYNHYRTTTIYRRRLAENETVDAVLVRTLDVLYTQKKCSLKRLCKIQGITNSTGSIMVDKYVKAGYISRQQREDDRRKVILTLTPKGTEYIEQVLEQQYAEMEKSLSALSEEDLKTLNDSILTVDAILHKLELLPEE